MLDAAAHVLSFAKADTKCKKTVKLQKRLSKRNLRHDQLKSMEHMIVTERALVGSPMIHGIALLLPRVPEQGIRKHAEPTGPTRGGCGTLASLLLVS